MFFYALGDLITDTRTKWKLILTNPMLMSLLNNSGNNDDRHRISKNFADQLFRSCHKFSLKNPTQFGSDSNCSLFTEQNTASNCFMATILVSVGLTKRRFGHLHVTTLLFFPSRSPSMCLSWT